MSSQRVIPDKEKKSATYDYDECIRYMKVGIDSCDCGGENDKQGGYVTNNCIKARIDPQAGI